MNSKFPNWLNELSKEEIKFIKNFVIFSGSFKELSKYYDVSYPTMKTKVNRLIEKIKLYDTDDNSEDDFVSYIKTLSLDDRISLEDAKNIISKYSEAVKNNGRD